MFKRTSLLFLLIALSFTAFSQSVPKLRANVELGYLGVLSNNIQFSNNGTNINYVTQGGQDVLFPVSRLSLDFYLTKRSSITLLYQPLRLESTQFLQEDIIVDDQLFAAGTGVRFLYNFPFYRASYLYEFLPNNKSFDFAFGPTLQIRNTTISFEEINGPAFRRNSNVGIVPALKFRAKKYFGSQYFVGLEADGIYAPVSYLNGSDEEIIGAILDASLNGGFRIRKEAFTFLNLRYIVGGAVGTNTDDTGPGDGFTQNWLNFVTVTVGFSYEFY